MQTNLIKRVADNVAVVAEKIQNRLERRRMVSLQPNKPAIGNVLISYVLDPFTLKPGEPISISHTQHWECLQMAKTFLDLGYNVDVIWFFNDTFLPKKDYAFFIETRWNLQRCAPFLNKEARPFPHRLFSTYLDASIFLMNHINLFLTVHLLIFLIFLVEIPVLYLLLD